MYTFKKEERLCSKKLIDELFHSGSSFLLYPFKVNLKNFSGAQNSPVQVVIVVPKRKFKRAHDRNLLKRRIREAYRLNKAELLYPSINISQALLLALTYVGKELHDYQFIEKKMKKVFSQAIVEYAKTNL